MRRRENEKIPGRAAGGGRTVQHSTLFSFHVSSVAWPLSRDWRNVESENNSVAVDVGVVLPRMQMDGESQTRRREIGLCPIPKTRRRQRRRPFGVTSARFQFNTYPMSPISYHSRISLATSRGSSSPGRLTCVRVVSHQQKAFNQSIHDPSLGNRERFFISPRRSSAERRTLARAQHNCTRAPRRASPDRSSRFLARRTPRDNDDTMSQMVRWGLSAGRVASPRNPSLSPAVATTRTIPRGRGSRARLTGRIPAVSRPSRRMPS